MAESSFDRDGIAVATVGDTLHYSAYDPRAGKLGGVVGIGTYANGGVVFSLDKKLSRFAIAAPSSDAALSVITGLYLGYRAECAARSATANLAVANGKANREAATAQAITAAIVERDAAIATATAQRDATIAALRNELANARLVADESPSRVELYEANAELARTVERLTAELATANEQLAAAPGKSRRAA